MVNGDNRTQDGPDGVRDDGERRSDGATVVANVLVGATMALLSVALLAIVVLRWS